MKKLSALIILLVVLTACGTKKDKQVTKVNGTNKITTKAAITTIAAVTTKVAIIEEPDAVVIIHEKTLNSFLKAIGEITGKAPFKVLFIDGEYTWSLNNARIDINPNNARFIADAKVSIGKMFSYSSVAEGNVDVKYDNVANKIHVKIQEAIFEVYLSVLGNKIHITDIDAAKYYKPEFAFAGPQPMQTEISIALPDLRNKKINVKITGQNLYIEKNQIKVTSILKFEEAVETTQPAIKISASGK